MCCPEKTATGVRVTTEGIRCIVREVAGRWLCVRCQQPADGPDITRRCIDSAEGLPPPTPEMEDARRVTLARSAAHLARDLTQFVVGGCRINLTELYRQRLKICRSKTCGFYSKGRCQHPDCGCFVTLKAAMPDMECPINLWPAAAPVGSEAV